MKTSIESLSFIHVMPRRRLSQLSLVKRTNTSYGRLMTAGLALRRLPHMMVGGCGHNLDSTPGANPPYHKIMIRGPNESELSSLIPPWRNWLARLTVNQEVGSSSLPGGDAISF